MESNIQVSFAGTPSVGRKLRKPRHTHQVRHRPWQIQPFMIAPVLPGETLKNLLLQARVVTDPIKHPLVGWWIEYYYFYVKHRDLAERQAMMDLVMTNTALTALNAVAKLETYHAAGMPDFSQLCLNRVVDTYFRDEGEATLAGAIGNLPSASIAQDTWLDSVKAASTNPATDPKLPGQKGEAADDVLSGFTAQYQQWEFMKQEKLTDLTYEDFLKTYGVKGAAVAAVIDEHKPELLRYVRDWSYPTNTVDPVSGVPASAVSWAVAERADKDRFFSEPGFIFGVTVARPKVYLNKQLGSGVDMLSDAFSWLPAVLSDDPYTSLRQFANNAGPLAGNVTDSAGYWVDVRDLFIYGDQFVNMPLNATEAAMVNLPSVVLQKRYASSVDADFQFVTPATKGLVRQDGVTQLQILGRLSDET
jgi:hypothetical protein